MEQKIALGKYPIYSHEISKTNCKFSSANQIIEYFKTQIENNQMASFIGIFDHYSHTKKVGGASAIPSNIIDIKNIVFCFGSQVPNVDIIAVRPRSIGVTELTNSFVINFLEAPGAMPNSIMTGWVKGI